MGSDTENFSRHTSVSTGLTNSTGGRSATTAGGNSTGSCGTGASGSCSRSWQQGSDFSASRVQSVQQVDSSLADSNDAFSRQMRTGVADAETMIPTQNSRKAASTLRMDVNVTAMRGPGQGFIPPESVEVRCEGDAAGATCHRSSALTMVALLKCDWREWQVRKIPLA